MHMLQQGLDTKPKGTFANLNKATPRSKSKMPALLLIHFWCRPLPWWWRWHHHHALPVELARRQRSCHLSLPFALCRRKVLPGELSVASYVADFYAGWSPAASKTACPDMLSTMRRDIYLCIA